MTQTLQAMPEPAASQSPVKTGHSTASPSDRGDVAFRVILCCILYAIPAVAAMREVTDVDLFWHLRVGQWIAEHGTVPTTDPFSSYGQGKPWVAYSWLFEVVVYDLYQRLGLAGVILYRVLLSLAIAVALHRFIARREPRFLVALGWTGLAFVVLLGAFNERPWLLTILFTILTLDAVLELRDGTSTRWIWLLPLVYVIWANTHIQFVYGFLLFGLAMAAPILDRLLGRTEAGDSARRPGTPRWWQLMALTLACMAATLLNPYGFRLYAVIVEYATLPGPFRVVVELTAPQFHDIWDWVTLFFVGAAAFSLGRRAQVPTFELLLLVASAYLAFHARRDAWFVVLAALAILTTAPRPAVLLAERFPMTPLRVASIAGVVLVVLGLTAWRRNLSEAGLQARIEQKFPVQAAAFVEQHGYPGPLFNHFNWGGYFIWRLPQLPAAIDGRTNLHGDERIFRFEDTWSAVPGWQDDPELTRAGVVIADARMPLCSVLRLDPRFERVYGDPVAEVFVARPPAKAE